MRSRGSYGAMTSFRAENAAEEAVGAGRLAWLGGTARCATPSRGPGASRLPGGRGARRLRLRGGGEDAADVAGGEGHPHVEHALGPPRQAVSGPLPLRVKARAVSRR